MRVIDAQFKGRAGPFGEGVSPHPVEMFGCVCLLIILLVSLHSSCVVHISSVTLCKALNDPVSQFPHL